MVPNHQSECRRPTTVSQGEDAFGKDETQEDKPIMTNSPETEHNNQRSKMTKKFLRDHCKQLNLYLCPRLNDTLYLHFNDFSTIENLEDLTELRCLYLQGNRIQILTVLQAVPNLKVLNLIGNEVVKNIPNYRKTVIVQLQNLTFLDERPVFPEERACAEAWAAGGFEGEGKKGTAFRLKPWRTWTRTKLRSI
uniref:Uncharacterized protein n=1 Tax=Takifugu rubripes TaxID=31033 RepID=A0A674PKQ5_TAKRU